MLRAAIALIGKHGSIGASLAQISTEAGYSHGLPIHRFGTKLKLLETVVDTVQERFMRQLALRTAGMEGCEALAERIRFQMEAVHDMPESAVALYHLIVDSVGAVPELKPRITALHAAYHESLRAYLLQAQKVGQLRQGVHIEQTARAISGAISGICIQALVSGDTSNLGEDAAFIADLFVARVANDSLAIPAKGGARANEAAP